jgi:serine/threonine-protein kinase
MGRHVVVARGGGFERQYEVTLAEGETKNLEITPVGGKTLPKAVASTEKSPPASPASRKDAPRTGSSFNIEGPSQDRAESGSNTQRTLGFITLGAGVVGLGVGGYFGARVLSKTSELSTMCTAENRCDDNGVADYEKTHREAVDARTYAYIGLGVGGAAAVTGVVLLLTAPKTSTAWRAAPMIGQGNVGAVVAGSW